MSGQCLAVGLVRETFKCSLKYSEDCSKQGAATILVLFSNGVVCQDINYWVIPQREYIFLFLVAKVDIMDYNILGSQL
jgi:hypothetical protein